MMLGSAGKNSARVMLRGNSGLNRCSSRIVDITGSSFVRPHSQKAAQEVLPVIMISSLPSWDQRIAPSILNIASQNETPVRIILDLELSGDFDNDDDGG